MLDYLKPTEACQTKAKSKNNTGIAGITSTIGRKAVKGSGKADSKKLICMVNLNFVNMKNIYLLYNNLI